MSLESRQMPITGEREMPDSDFRLGFRCGFDSSEWVATLGRVGARYGFLNFTNSTSAAEKPTENERGALRRRLDELLSAPTLPPLPPRQAPKLLSVVGQSTLPPERSP